MNSISIKELRTMLPVVRDQLKKGETFLVIFKSKPIAVLKPVDALPTLEELNDNEMEEVAMLEFGADEDCLDESELNYYLSLKDYRQ